MNIFCRCSSHLPSVDFKLRKLPWIIWVGLIPSVEDLKSKNWGFLKKEFCLKSITWNPCLSFQPVSLPYRFQICQPPQPHDASTKRTHAKRKGERGRENIYTTISIYYRFCFLENSDWYTGIINSTWKISGTFCYLFCWKISHS